jgi:hypothetical protein
VHSGGGHHRRRAVNAVLALQEAFQQRLSGLKSIGRKLSTELAESDLAAIGLVLRNLEAVVEGFEK